MSLVSAFLIAVVIATLARQAGALDLGGTIAAALVGAGILAGQDWRGGLILLAFFIPTSAVSRLLPDATIRLDAKGNRRDAWQVLANGGVATAAALGWSHSDLGLAVTSAALAGAAADTWATSWGSGSRTPPRSILTGRLVTPGTSGGITWRGTIGGTAGAVVVGFVAFLVSGNQRLGAIAVFAGLGGMLFDSILGAGVQGRFHCDRCEVPTERPVHRCGAESRPVGGIGWLNNDAVNAAATLFAALLGWLCYS